MTVSAAKRIGLGTTLSVRPSTFTAGGSTVFVVIANIVNPPTGPDGTAVDINVHTLDDGQVATFQKGVVDPGGGTLDIMYDPVDASGQLLAQLFLAGTGSAMPQWQIGLPVASTSTARTETFSAYVNAQSRAMPKDGMLVRTIGFHASGNPGFTTST